MFLYYVDIKRVFVIGFGKFVIGVDVLVNDVEYVFVFVYVLSINNGFWLFDYEKESVKLFLIQIEIELGVIEIVDVLMCFNFEIYIGM